MNLVVLPDRKCGTPRKGLYMTGELSPSGTLLPFTALAAPFEAIIAHPRSYQKVDIWETLYHANGLRTSGCAPPFAGLPQQGIADLWGKSAGYECVYDVAIETCMKGICRRIAKVPDLETPFPVLMMHMHAVVDAPIPEMAWDWLETMGIEWSRTQGIENPIDVLDRPWQAASSLGRVGDQDYMTHPHFDLWRVISEMAVNENYLDWWLEDNQVELRQGVFGLGWITKVVYVLGKDDEEVPEAYADRGVLPAVNTHDPRAAGATHE